MAATRPGLSDGPLPLLYIPEADLSDADAASAGAGAGKFTVGEDAAAALSAIEGKVAVVAVTGKYRTGKSFLCNALLGAHTLGASGMGSESAARGFSVGSTVERCTRGIWVMGAPVKAVNDAGEELSVVVLDTEGFGATEAAADDDARIFALATLLCSLLVYNSMGTINEEAIQGLSFVANMTRHIQVRGSSSDDGGGDSSSGTGGSGSGSGGGAVSTVAELQAFFPGFLWVVRDFALELVDDDGDVMSARDYLEDCLAQRDGFSSDVLERNRIRKVLTSFFRERACVTLPRPAAEEEALQALDKAPYESLKAGFRRDLEALRGDVLARLAPPKRLNGKFLNGRMLVGLARAYAAAINSDAVPSIGSAWESVSQGECKAALAAGEAAYSAAMDAGVLRELPVPQSRLQEAHDEACATALAAYDDDAVGSDADVASFRAQLESRMEAALGASGARNTTASEEQCASVAADLRAELLDPHLRVADSSDEAAGGAMPAYADGDRFAADLETFVERYGATARGPAAPARLAAALQGIADAAVRHVGAEVRSRLEAALEAAAHRARAAQSALDSMREQQALREAEAEAAAARGAALEAELSALKPALEREKDRARKLEADCEAARAEATALTGARDDALERAAASDARLAEVTAEAATLRDDVASLRASLDDATRQAGEAQSAADALQRQLDAKAAALATSEGALEAARAEAAAAHAEELRLKRDLEASKQASRKLTVAAEDAAEGVAGLEAAKEKALARATALHGDVGRLTAERDALRRDVEAAHAATVAAQRKLAEAQADFDARDAAMRAEVAAAGDALDAAEAQRSADRSNALAAATVVAEEHDKLVAHLRAQLDAKGGGGGGGGGRDSDGSDDSGAGAAVNARAVGTPGPGGAAAASGDASGASAAAAAAAVAEAEAKAEAEAEKHRRERQRLEADNAKLHKDLVRAQRDHAAALASGRGESGIYDGDAALHTRVAELEQQLREAQAQPAGQPGQPQGCCVVS